VTIRELVAESRARQGLGPTVSDPAALARLAALVGTHEAGAARPPAAVTPPARSRPVDRETRRPDGAGAGR
jgi:hypothetical protein